VIDGKDAFLVPGLWDVHVHLAEDREIPEALRALVEQGKKADLVLLDADPLEDVRNIRRIRMVLVKGRPVPLRAPTRQEGTQDEQGGTGRGAATGAAP